MIKYNFYMKVKRMDFPHLWEEFWTEIKIPIQ